MFGKSNELSTPVMPVGLMAIHAGIHRQESPPIE